MVVSQTDSSISAIGGRRLIPALETTMSGSPKGPATASQTARIPGRDDGSPATAGHDDR